MKATPSIAVVIPAYQVADHILAVVNLIGSQVSRIYVIDDCCPDQSWQVLRDQCDDERVRIIHHQENLGVGGAVMTGYAAAIKDKIDIVVKVDGDGQMDPRLIPMFTDPIIGGQADYTKGNRFFDLKKIRLMPTRRLIGNAALSFVSKLSTGYWNLFDPTNGYTAIHAAVAAQLPFEKISRRYFFETDMLFRLNLQRAVVVDIPMDAKYGQEASNLKISRVVAEFMLKHARNFCKRIFYNYYLRDMSLASIELPAGLLMVLFGVSYGSYHWLDSLQTNLPATSGTVMLSAMPVLIGIQLLLGFIGHDVSSVPRQPFHRLKSNPISAAEHTQDHEE